MRFSWLVLLATGCGGVEPDSAYQTAECAALCAEGADCTDTHCLPALYRIEVLETATEVEVAMVRGEDRQVVLVTTEPAASEPVRFRPGAEVEVVGDAACTVYADELLEMPEWTCGGAQIRAVRG